MAFITSKKRYFKQSVFFFAIALLKFFCSKINYKLYNIHYKLFIQSAILLHTQLTELYRIKQLQIL